MPECVFVYLVCIKAPHHLHYVRHAWTCQEHHRVAQCTRAHARRQSVGLFCCQRQQNRGAVVPDSTLTHVRSFVFGLCRSVSSQPPPLFRSNSRTSGDEDGKARRFAGADEGFVLRQQLNASSRWRTHSLSKSLVTHATTAESPWKLMLRGRQGPRQHKGRFPLSIA